MHQFCVLAALLSSFVSVPAFAADPAATCSSYVGTSVTPITYSQAVAKLPKAIGPKGEFETTAQYEARKTKAAPASTIIVGVKSDPSGFAYDADKQRLSVTNSAFNSGSFDTRVARDVISGFPDTDTIHFSIEAVVENSIHTTGSYAGQNSFGARAQITKRERVVHDIYDHATNEDMNDGGSIFVDSDHDVIGTFDLSPEAAKTLKSKLKTALVVIPKDPYFVHTNYNEDEPTVDNPNELRDVISLMIAHIQCGLLIDGSNKVLASYQVRQPS